MITFYLIAFLAVCLAALVYRTEATRRDLDARLTNVENRIDVFQSDTVERIVSLSRTFSNISVRCHQLADNCVDPATKIRDIAEELSKSAKTLTSPKPEHRNEIPAIDPGIVSDELVARLREYCQREGFSVDKVPPFPKAPEQYGGTE